MSDEDLAFKGGAGLGELVSKLKLPYVYETPNFYSLDFTLFIFFK